MYRVAADIAGVEVKEISLKADFQLSVDDVLSQINKYSKLLFLCSPNNPTGNLLKRDDIIEIIHHFPGIVVLDEAYIDFADVESFLPVLADFPNLVILQTFSKAWGLAGIRMGMAFSSKEITEFLNKIKSPYNLNVLTTDFVSKQLDFLSEKKAAVEILKKERQSLSDSFNTFSFVQKVFSSDANFILIRTEEADRLYLYLVSKGIIVRNRSNMPLCEGTLRITVGNSQENEFLLDTLKEWEKLNS